MQTIADVVRHVGLTDLPGSYPGRTVNVNREEKYENMNVALSAALQSTLQNAGVCMSNLLTGSVVCKR